MIRYFVHVFLTLLFTLAAGILFLISQNGSVNYGMNDLQYKIDLEGPHVFYENDSILSVNYIRGNREEGFYKDFKLIRSGDQEFVSCYFPLDQSYFHFELLGKAQIPASIYEDGEPILAISDIESGYRTFRDFLIANKVINQNLEWIFDQGHLVLLGDFMDRGSSTTQVLWMIYKLEQEALKSGGKVHFIIGNHELYNMQGKFKSASPKYHAIAHILGKMQHELYGPNAVLGQWLSSKNCVEKINGHLFAHGGIHRDLAQIQLSLEEINDLQRQSYYRAYYPSPDKTKQQIVTSSKTGICWYRGYFKKEMNQREIEETLKVWGAKAVVVGHTIQRKVCSLYQGKVFGIDVKHPKDYSQNWPKKSSEGLLIKDEKYFRVFVDRKPIPL